MNWHAIDLNIKFHRLKECFFTISLYVVNQLESPTSDLLASMNTNDEGLLVQIASYNTNLQGNAGLPQDLVDWLSPTLQVSGFLSREKKTPDVVAVGFQELLPLNLGCMFAHN